MTPKTTAAGGLLPAAYVENLGAYLPSLICLDGRPMRLVDHFPMAPFFSTLKPRIMTVVAGRQVGKTQSESASILLQSAAEPGLKTLVVLPLQEQSDRFSSEYFRPMLEDSPIRVVLGADRAGDMGSVRRRSFKNRSTINFTYAGQSVERARGITARLLVTDETQDIDPHHMPVLDSVQDSFPSGAITLHTGTAKTLDTLLNKRYNASSMAVWVIRCGCGFDNWCVDGDGHILKMMGEIRPDVSEARPGTICAKCGGFVNPRTGRWIHRFRDKMAYHAGYLMPQLIFPTHFAHPDKWQALINKRDGKIPGWTYGKFLNEALGLAYELSTRLLTQADLRKAAVLGPNTLEHARAVSGRYPFVVLGCDWGGGGADGGSLTRVAAVGMAPDGAAEVFYGATMPFGLDPVEEAKEVVKIAHALGVHYIAHDFNGAGSVREAVVVNIGWPIEQIAPIVYNDLPGRRAMHYEAATGHRYRGYYHLSKPRSLQFVASFVRHGQMRFFEYDYKGEGDPGLLNDWTNYVENSFTSPSGQSVYQVRAASETATTDFADATNMAASFMWTINDAWPVLAAGM